MYPINNWGYSPAAPWNVAAAPNDWGYLPAAPWNVATTPNVVGEQWTRGQDVDNARRWGETTVYGDPYGWGPTGIAETRGFSQTSTSEQSSVGVNNLVNGNIANIW